MPNITTGTIKLLNVDSHVSIAAAIYILYIYATAYIQYAKDVFVKMIFCANIIYIVFELNYTRSAVRS